MPTGVRSASYHLGQLVNGHPRSRAAAAVPGFSGGENLTAAGPARSVCRLCSVAAKLDVGRGVGPAPRVLEETTRGSSAGPGVPDRFTYPGQPPLFCFNLLASNF